MDAKDENIGFIINFKIDSIGQRFAYLFFTVISIVLGTSNHVEVGNCPYLTCFVCKVALWPQLSTESEPLSKN